MFSLFDQILVFCIKNVPLKIYFPYLAFFKNRIHIHIKWEILAWLSYDLLKFGETMTYLKKKLPCKQIACFSFAPSFTCTLQFNSRAI